MSAFSIADMKKNVLSLVALCVSVFVIGTAEYLIAGILPQVAEDLRVSEATAGQAVTAYALGVVIGGPLVAMATSRMPRKGLALAMVLVFAVGSALCAFAGSYEMLLVGRVVSALSHAAFLAIAVVMATTLVPAEKVGTAIAAVASGFTVATLLAYRWARCSARRPAGGRRSSR